MLKINENRVLALKRVFFVVFTVSLSSQTVSLSVFPLGLLSSSVCIENGGNSEKGNHLPSATSNIGLEFSNKFLNMSKLQSRLISLYHRVPLQIDLYERYLVSISKRFENTSVSLDFCFCFCYERVFVYSISDTKNATFKRFLCESFV